jgi:hypothetical protein
MDGSWQLLRDLDQEGRTPSERRFGCRLETEWLGGSPRQTLWMYWFDAALMTNHRTMFDGFHRGGMMAWNYKHFYSTCCRGILGSDGYHFCVRMHRS